MVETVLNKIADHNSSVIACIASKGGRTWNNLPDMYSMVDTEGASEHAANIFAVTDGLETEHLPFDQLFLEFDNHSFYARRLEDGLLLLMNEPMERASFKKMQVGVNLFVKPLRQAMDHAAEESARAVAEPALVADRVEEPAPAPAEQPAPRKKRFYRGVEY